MRIRCIRMRALVNTGYRHNFIDGTAPKDKTAPQGGDELCFRQFTNATRHPEKRRGRLPRFVAHQVTSATYASVCAQIIELEMKIRIFWASASLAF